MLDSENKKEFVDTIIEPAFTDERGDIFDILEGEEVGHVGIITFTESGIARGKHYHKISYQYSYILDGELDLIISDIDGGNRKVYPLQKGSFNVIPPNVVHTYVSKSPARMLDLNTLDRKDDGYENDTVRVEVEI